MSQTKKIQSIRRLLLTTIISLIVVLFVAAITKMTLVLIDQTNEHLEQDSRSLAALIAQTSIPYLKENKHAKLKNLLKSLHNIPSIHYIHIYRINDNQQPTFFTSYNKNDDFPPIADKIGEINSLTTIQYHADYMEFISKIKEKGKTYGYIYIQSSLDYQQQSIEEIIYNGIGIIIIAIFIIVFVVLNLHTKISQPISALIHKIQTIAQRKDFSMRVGSMPFKEQDILTRSIDFLLTRIEKHITKQESAKTLMLKQNQELEDKVTKRTDALKESNHELLSTLEKLHQFQGQLVENEKMASLGDMVAGVAHEVNTPIGLGVTASTLLSDRLDEIKQHFENKTLKSSQLKKFLDDGQENITMIYRNLDRAAKLIASFKQVAVDQSSEESSEFNVKTLLDEVLLSLAPQLRNESIHIELVCPDELTIYSKPGPINQILINLIINSVLHGFENSDEGKINISVMLLSDQLQISYRDDGQGIDEAIKTRIFEPFTTTKRGSGGSGLGMHLVYNLVTQALNGQIHFTSEKNHGVDFEITFPVKSHE